MMIGGLIGLLGGLIGVIIGGIIGDQIEYNQELERRRARVQQL
jgi:ABC-type lipoprotein release transport system permease subunit